MAHKYRQFMYSMHLHPHPPLQSNYVLNAPTPTPTLAITHACIGAQQQAVPKGLSRKNDLVVWLRLKPLQRAVYEAFLHSEAVSCQSLPPCQHHCIPPLFVWSEDPSRSDSPMLCFLAHQLLGKPHVPGKACFKHALHAMLI